METNRRSPFGIQLRQFREATGLSQEELAERASLSVRGISDLERGLRATPRLETVRMLADGLGLDEVERRQLLEARNSTIQSSYQSNPNSMPGFPRPTTSFIGREDQVYEVVNSLEQDRTRLVTLTGPGGVGKTRIVIEVARRLAESFSHGAIFVDLASIRKPEMVVPAIAARLGILVQDDLDILNLVIIALHYRNLLMVLDNFEQVIDAAPDVAGLLDACPELTIVVTSRVILRVAAEQVMPIDPLNPPADDEESTLERSEAVNLFIARSRAVDHRFSLNSGNAKVVAAIVIRLQGIPLAIELAAARVRLFPLSELLQRLDSQLRLLTGGARDAPARHQTMSGTIAWSYELLSATQQAVFRTLAIFPDGCTLRTAISILCIDGDLAEADAVDAVETLIDSSMLRPRTGVDGQVRHRMLQTLQEFGLELLAGLGDEHQARLAAHERWCIPITQEGYYVTVRPDLIPWLNLVDAEYQNLRVHLSWLIESGRTEDALAVSASLAAFRSFRGHLYGEGRRELEMLLQQPPNQEATEGRLLGLIALGELCNQQSAPARAFTVLEEAADLARALGRPRYLSTALLLSVHPKIVSGEINVAEALAIEGARLAESIGDRFESIRGLMLLAFIYEQKGNLEQSNEMFQQGLAASRSNEYVLLVDLAHLNLAYHSLVMSQFDEAEAHSREALRISRELGWKVVTVQVHETLADIARLQHDLPLAEELLYESLALAREIGVMREVAVSLYGLARITRITKPPAVAKALIYEAIHWFEWSGSVVDAVQCLEIITDLAIDASNGPRAAWCIGARKGVLAAHGVTHRRFFPVDFQDQEIASKELLSEHDWHMYHDAALTMSEADIMVEVKSWQHKP